MDDILPENAWGEDDSSSDDDDRTSKDATHNKDTIGNDYDEYGDDDKDGTEFGAQHVLILIDCHWSMFQQHPTGSSNSSGTIEPFDAALCAVNELLKLRIQHVATTKSGKRDGVGVLFFGTRPQRNTTKKTTYNWMPLAPPGIAQVLHLAKYLLPQQQRQQTLQHLSPPSSMLLSLPQILVEETTNRTTKTSSNMQRDLLQQEFASAATAGETSTFVSTLRLALLESYDIFTLAKCVHTPTTKQKQSDTNTLWIFTNQDDPCHGNDEETKQLTKIAQDVLQNGIDIQLFPLPKSSNCNNNIFDRTLFYDRILPPNRVLEEEEDDHPLLPSTFNLHHFLNQIQQQTKQRRPIRGVRLLLPDSTTTKEEASSAYYGIALELYRFVQVQRKPGYEWVTNATNKVVIKETNTIVDSGQAEFVTKQNKEQILRTYVQFGESRIPFTKEQVQTVKRNSLGGRFPCLLLLGFQKPNITSSSSSTTTWHEQQMNRSYLAYPSEEDAPGSKLAFAALHEAMYRNGVVGIGELSVSSTSETCSVPRLVRIVPQPEKRQLQSSTSRKTVQIEPPGFILTPLPYEDDVRAAVSERACTTASEETVNTMKELIVAQQSSKLLDDEDDDDDFEYFRNPALTKFWNYIEAVALTQPVAEFVDETEMERNVPVFDKRRSELMDRFQSLLPEEDEMQNKKRKAAGSTKINSNEDGMLDFQQMLKDGTLDKCTNAVLKGYLQSVGLPQTGNKKVLLGRIAASIECPLEKKVKQEFNT